MDKKTISKKSKMIAATAFVLGMTAIGAGVAQADTTSTASTNRMSSLVSAIAEKFNLNSSDVQTVVNNVMTTQRAEMEAKHEQEFTTRLAQSVTDGKLTQSQADLITEKEKELQVARQSEKTANQTLTEAERQAKMKEERTALSTWATDNNIPVEYLRMGFVGGRGHRGLGGFKGVAPTTTTQASS